MYDTYLLTYLLRDGVNIKSSSLVSSTKNTSTSTSASTSTSIVPLLIPRVNYKFANSRRKSSWQQVLCCICLYRYFYFLSFMTVVCRAVPARCRPDTKHQNANANANTGTAITE